jgi:hypothetical protein
MRTLGIGHRASHGMPPARPTSDSAPAARGDRATAAARHIALRLKVFASRGRLDREIATGGAPEADAALALRARQLTEARSQQRTARHLRGVVDDVERRAPGPVISAVVIEPRAVREGRGAIMQLAERLERSGSVDARGVILARTLLTNSRSPLFDPRCERTVTQAVEEIHEALGGS